MWHQDSIFQREIIHILTSLICLYYHFIGEAEHVIIERHGSEAESEIP